MRTGLLLAMICSSVAVCHGARTGFLLSNKDAKARISAQGRLTELEHGGYRQVFLEPARITIRDEITGRTEEVNGPIEESGQTELACWYTQRLPGLIIASRLELDTDLRWQVRLFNQSAERRDLSVWFHFGTQSSSTRLFFPGSRAEPAWPLPSGELRYGYRTDGEALVIPSATFYSKSEQTGLTIMSPLAIPIQPFGVLLDAQRNVTVGRTGLRVEPHGSVLTAILLDVHEPDWRPGLKYVRDKYPNYFTTTNNNALGMNGPFLWSPTAAEDQVRQWSGQGVRWVEVHFTYPFLGKYVPDQLRWTPAMDDWWAYEKRLPVSGVPKPNAPFQLIRQYIEKRIPPEETPDKVRNFIRLLHRYGIKALMYFQPTECWSSYAAEYFMPDAYRNEVGDTEPTWYEDIVLNPRPGGAWASYLEQQFHKLLELYPDADGVFMDEAVADGIDYAHDDGFTIRSGRIGYRMGYAICALTAKLVNYAHKLGKIVWWNGPYQVEIGSLGDGHLAEASDERIKWLGIGNKPITSGASSPGDYDRMLLAGIQCAAPSLASTSNYAYSDEVPANAAPTPLELSEFERYRPLFDQLREREWVLNAQAVEVDQGFEANIFRQPNGNYVVPVITPFADATTGISFDVTVRVNVPDAASVRGVYSLDSELPGWRRVPWRANGHVIVVRIPRQRRASVLLFAKTGMFASVDGDGTMTEGQPRPATLILDNFLSTTGRGELQIGDHKQVFALAPGASRRFTIRASAIKEVSDDRLGIPISVSSSVIPGGHLSFTQQFQNVPSLEVGWVGKLHGYVGEESTVKVYIANHRDDVQWAHMDMDISDVQLKEQPQAITLAAKERRYVSVRIFPKRVGRATVRVHIASHEATTDILMPFPVSRTRFDPNVDVVGGRLEFAEFVPTGMPDPMHLKLGIERPITLDGKKIGSLPSRNQSRWLGTWRLPLKPSQLLRIDRTLEVAFKPANANDNFSVRNIRVVLNFSDGSEIASTTIKDELSTVPCNKGPAQPISVRLDIPNH